MPLKAVGGVLMMRLKLRNKHKKRLGLIAVFHKFNGKIVDFIGSVALEINVENSSKSHTTRFDIFQEKALFQLVRTCEDIV